MNQNNKYKKSVGGNRSDEAEMRKALKEIIRLVEALVDSDERKAEATMLKILNTALEVVLGGYESGLCLIHLRDLKFYLEVDYFLRRVGWKGIGILFYILKLRFRYFRCNHPDPWGWSVALFERN